MSQQDNFASGFFLGAIVGGVVGGIMGAVVGSRLANVESAPVKEETFSKLDTKTGKVRRNPLKPSTEQSIEGARRGLEDKIAQLNDAIDDVRQQLGKVNGAPREEMERAIAKDN